MRALLIAAAGLSAVACAPTADNPGATQSAAPPGVGCGALAQSLRACAPASCRQPHPFVPSFIIEHRVMGSDGAVCAYSQSMPSDMSMSCRFSPEGRAEMAHVIEEMERGNLSGGTGRQSAMTRECTVHDSSGGIVPWS